MIFRAAEAISQQALFSLYWTSNTSYGGASAGEDADYQYLEACSGLRSPENG